VFTVKLISFSFSLLKRGTNFVWRFEYIFILLYYFTKLHQLPKWQNTTRLMNPSRQTLWFILTDLFVSFFPCLIEAARSFGWLRSLCKSWVSAILTRRLVWVNVSQFQRGAQTSSTCRRVNGIYTIRFWCLRLWCLRLWCLRLWCLRLWCLRQFYV
jgi:hypothetical protein